MAENLKLGVGRVDRLPHKVEPKKELLAELEASATLVVALVVKGRAEGWHAKVH